MRIAPMVFPYLKAPAAELWVDTALSAMLTHNDSASISACLAAIHLIWRLFQMEAPLSPHWWIDEYAKIAGALEIDN